MSLRARQFRARVRTRLRSERGAATAEYAITTLAAEKVKSVLGSGGHGSRSLREVTALQGRYRARLCRTIS
ncbi:DUF4244 domain-containing protein [Salinibacterium sp. NG22]|nr:DUF4244 domain-containing protein [Salinibacterium sp. NG22]